MGSIMADFNEATNEANSERYPSEGRKVCPRFFFKITAKGISYEFDHAGDRGSGAKTRHLAIFDVAMRSAVIPYPRLIEYRARRLCARTGATQRIHSTS